jgi:hypothetical protein
MWTYTERSFLLRNVEVCDYYHERRNPGIPISFAGAVIGDPDKIINAPGRRTEQYWIHGRGDKSTDCLSYMFCSGPNLIPRDPRYYAVAVVQKVILSAPIKENAVLKDELRRLAHEVGALTGTAAEIARWVPQTQQHHQQTQQTIRLELESKRRQNRQCILCGLNLDWLLKVRQKDRHPHCREFRI